MLVNQAHHSRVCKILKIQSFWKMQQLRLSLLANLRLPCLRSHLLFCTLGLFSYLLLRVWWTQLLGIRLMGSIMLSKSPGLFCSFMWFLLFFLKFFHLLKFMLDLLKVMFHLLKVMFNLLKILFNLLTIMLDLLKVMFHLLKILFH